MEIGLQDALQQFNIGKGAWYGWIDSSLGMVYSNLKLNDETAVVPTEEEVNQKIAELQWEQNRRNSYGSIADQLDMMYWDGVNGTTVWADHIAQVKSDNPKPV